MNNPAASSAAVTVGGVQAPRNGEDLSSSSGGAECVRLQEG